ncbi:MAG: DUF6384 family protein [Acetobacteraceae bacterium]|nr:DUF6384 family protein [Acetobacteraceae bacterium]MDI3309567.1 DUF6384 family protein [Acetobacteraceae bacterium]
MPPDTTAPAASREPPLDETMLAMDVVDTLRHADRLVERELSADQRAARLKQRLREIYASQGIEVPERILDQGVAALEEQRFTYRPTPPGPARSLAKLWVTRGRRGRPLGMALLALVLLGGGWWFGVHLPEERARIAEQQELQDMPRMLQAERERVLAATQDASARQRADRLAAEGEAAARAGALGDAQVRLAQLRELQQVLAQDYTVRIVSRPGEPSGIWRVPQANPRARNFYLIVEAVDRDGKPVQVPVTSEEDGRTARVSKWGLRVPAEEFERVRQDKLRDGVVDQPVVGMKRAGELQPSWSVPTSGGAILQW